MQRIPKAEYARRRKALMAQMEPNSIAILPAAPVYIRNRDVEHIYRQDSDFQYLTGFPEPEAVLALIPGREHGEYVLFCRERDPERELWDGLRAGQDGAIAQVQSGLEESEDGESDYMEVMEYLRVAPLLLFAECGKPAAPAPKPSLH